MDVVPCNIPSSAVLISLNRDLALKESSSSTLMLCRGATSGQIFIVVQR